MKKATLSRQPQIPLKFNPLHPLMPSWLHTCPAHPSRCSSLATRHRLPSVLHLPASTPRQLPQRMRPAITCRCSSSRAVVQTRSRALPSPRLLPMAAPSRHGFPGTPARHVPSPTPDTVRVCVCVRACVRVNVYVYVYMCSCMCKCVDVCVCVCVFGVIILAHFPHWAVNTAHLRLAFSLFVTNVVVLLVMQALTKPLSLTSPYRTCHLPQQGTRQPYHTSQTLPPPPPPLPPPRHQLCLHVCHREQQP